jgi:hypothetical protein
MSREQDNMEKMYQKETCRFLHAWKVKDELHFTLSPTANFTEIQEEFGEGQFLKKIKTPK